MYRLIDTHAHLEELADLPSALDKAKEIGIIGVVAVGSDYQSNLKVLKIAQDYPGFVFPALGLHPWGLENLTPVELDENLRFIESKIDRTVAIGEIGLDYDKRVIKVSPKAFQQEVLKRLLNLARKYDKPAIIHSRYAWQDAYNLVKEVEVKQAVFHWFTGFSSVLRSIIDAGYFISATPAAEYHEEHRRAIKDAPLDRLLLETDCPVVYGKEARYTSQPADISGVVRAVAAIKGVDEVIIAEQTTSNAIDLFGLKTA